MNYFRVLVLWIACLGLAPTLAWAAPAAIIVSDPALPDHNAALAALLTGTLRQAGYAPVSQTIDSVSQPGALTPENCGLLVVPQAREMPTVLIPAVQRYLEAGGHILVLGAPMWANPLVQESGGQWISIPAEMQKTALLPPPHVLFDFSPGTDLSGWRRTSNTMSSPTRQEITTAAATGRAAGALHVTISNQTGWDTFGSPDLIAPFPSNNTLTVFSARGGPRTDSLAVEWDEADGSRWIATVPLAAHWQRYVLPPQAFHSWQNSPERARAGFRPDRAVRVSVGLAFSHTGARGGRHEYWVARMGTAPPDAPGIVVTQAQAEIPAWDTIAPRYKFFPIHGKTTLTTSPGADVLAALRPAAGTVPALWSAPPRPSGAGWDKRRGWRWASLLTARDAKTGEWRGSPATLLVHAPGATDGGGAWASFGIADTAFYQRPAVQRMLGEIAARMRDGLFLIEGGAQFYTLFPGQAVQMGAQVADLAPAGEAARHAVVRITVTDRSRKTVWSHAWPAEPGHGASLTFHALWLPPKKWPVGDYMVTTELIEAGRTIDRLRHALNVWTPPAKPRFITIGKDGHFRLTGRLWRANGVNYMPSSGIGIEDNQFFENWIDGAPYDPEIVERDLTHIQKMGLNAVSAFIYTDSVPAQNLLDFLRRCRNHHLHVNLALRPGLPDNWDWAKIRTILDYYHLPQNDTVFAYDIAWEPGFGDHDARTKMDAQWNRWIIAHHGSIAGAEKAWGYPAPRTASGAVTNPSDTQVSSAGGPWTRMVADYRHFLDDWLANTYTVAVRELHAADPRHAVSFRMSEAGDPTNHGGGGLPYQFAGISRAVDLLEPEAYGRIGDWQKVKPGRFETAYGRAVAPGKPFVWAEVGNTVWNEAAGDVDPAKLQSEGQFYTDFYKMARLSGADGLFFWWYPGGYRVNERSDFGLINPDGTDRPATIAVRQSSPAFLHAPAPRPPNIWLTFDRDRHPDGIAGIYDTLTQAFWSAIAQGKRPGLRAISK